MSNCALLPRPFTALHSLCFLPVWNLKSSQRWQLTVFSGLFWVCVLPWTFVWLSRSLIYRGSFQSPPSLKILTLHLFLPWLLACLNCDFTPSNSSLFIWLSVCLRNVFCIFVSLLQESSELGENRPLLLVLGTPQRDPNKHSSLGNKMYFPVVKTRVPCQESGVPPSGLPPSPGWGVLGLS